MKPVLRIRGLKPIRDHHPQDKVRRLIMDAKEKLGDKPSIKDYLFKELRV